MCLYFDPTLYKNATERTVIYKAFWQHPNGTLYNLYEFISKRTEYTLGKETVSDRSSTQLTDKEVLDKSIEKGFHGFTEFDAAYLFLEEYSESLGCDRKLNEFYHLLNDDECITGANVLVKCLVDFKDHVADGCGKEVVYHKIKPIEIVFKASLNRSNDNALKFEAMQEQYKVVETTGNVH